MTKRTTSDVGDWVLVRNGERGMRGSGMDSATIYIDFLCDPPTQWALSQLYPDLSES